MTESVFEVDKPEDVVFQFSSQNIVRESLVVNSHVVTATFFFFVCSYLVGNAGRGYTV